MNFLQLVAYGAQDPFIVQYASARRDVPERIVAPIIRNAPIRGSMRVEIDEESELELGLESVYKKIDFVIKGECGVCYENCQTRKCATCVYMVCQNCLIKINKTNCVHCKNKFVQ